LSTPKSFKVFGESIEILVSAETTNGLSTTIAQTSPPGGGPPPHLHTKEDESFYVLYGEYEFLKDGQWQPVPHGQAIHAPRGSVHTFRNVGDQVGKMLIFITPGGFENYLEEISAFAMPDDLDKVLAVSERYGISFPH
jgi:quercetin dioxygenase-like cupin family protein